MIASPTTSTDRSRPVTPPIAFDVRVDSDRCVLCGLCLPHCPTYRLTGDENESPRGRISLIRAMATGILPVQQRIATHLSRCLNCRACERVCPSGVRYGRLIEAGRAAVTGAYGLTLRTRLALTVLTRKSLIAALAALLRVVQQSGLQALWRASRLSRRLGTGRLDRMLPTLQPTRRLDERYPSPGAHRGRVALFTGCIARAVDPQTITVAIRLLTRFGYEVWVPPGQTCCGGLHRECGDADGARRLLAQNVRSFDPGEQLPVITLASGCGAALLAEVSSGSDSTAFARRIQDIHTFLAELELPPGLQLEPRDECVAVHDPCSLRNGMRSEQAVYRLLGRIPDLRVEPLPENSLCCGGAGGYLLREPVMADRLRNPKIDFITTLKPDRVVSANLGCVLHLSAGLREQGIDLPVQHPLVIFEQQLRGLKPGS